MIRSLIRYMKGYVKIRTEGFSPERFINMCSLNGIYIWGLVPSRNGYEMYLELRGLKKIRPLAKKTHSRIVISERKGLPFFIYRQRRRKLFYAGILMCAVLLKVYSLFIWDIHFEGNVKWPDETLAEFLRGEDVAPLMLKDRVDCQGIVKNIRKEYNDIVWVSASLEGNRLNIRVKENDDSYPEEAAENAEAVKAADLVASSDGVVTDIVTRSGVPQVHEGDAVEKGDILVRGSIEVKNDAGETVGYQYCRADADVYADTELTYEAAHSLTDVGKVYDGKEKQMFYIRAGKIRISAGSTENTYPHWDMTGKERTLKLGENVYLPLCFGTRKVRSFSYREVRVSAEEARKSLSEEFQRFCTDLEEKGIQIRGNNVKINLSADSAKAQGTIWLNEPITEEADTEIITVEREETDEPVGTDN